MAGPNITVFTGSEITAQDFAILMEYMNPVKSGIIKDCDVTLKNSTTLHVTSGWVIVRGRLIRIDEGDIAVPLSSSGSSTRYLILQVNLANNDAPAQYQIVSSIPADSADFNVRMGVASTQLASFTVSTTAVSNVKKAAKLQAVPAIRVGTEAPSNSLGVDGDIYIKIS